MKEFGQYEYQDEDLFSIYVIVQLIYINCTQNISTKAQIVNLSLFLKPYPDNIICPENVFYIYFLSLLLIIYYQMHSRLILSHKQTL